MRVLLPLRKPAANKQSSDENPSALEGAEVVDVNETVVESIDGVDLSEGLRVSLSPTELSTPLSDQFAGGKTRSESLQLANAQQKLPAVSSVPKGAWKTTGLQSHEPDRKRSAVLPRKRPRPSADDIRKRPAVERKPAAKPLKMGLGQAGRKSSQDAFPYNENVNSNLRSRPLVTRNELEEGEDPSVDGEPVSSCANPRAPSRASSTYDSVFALELKKRGLEMQEQEGDGNCLFRAVSLQVYGDSSMHGQVRKQCMDFMVSVQMRNIPLNLKFLRSLCNE